MEARSVGAVLNAIVIAAYAVGAAWRGFHHRRAYWTPRSWIGLGLVLLIGLALLAGAFLVALAIDDHEAWVGAPRSPTRAKWVLVMFGSVTGGLVTVGGSLTWFAGGEPSRQFPFFGSSRNPRRDAAETASVTPDGS